MITAIFLFAGALVIQLPQIQTAVTGKAVKVLSEKLDGNIHFEKIHFRPFTTLVIKNASITDKSPATDPTDSTSVKVDTFFRAEYIIAKFTLEGLMSQEGLHLDRAYISNAQMTLVIEDNPDSSFRQQTTENLSRIFGLKQPEAPKKSEKEIFHIRRVRINDMGFALKNYSSKKTQSKGIGGINWNDLDIKNINIRARELQFKGGVMSGELNTLSFIEKSGYQVKAISGKAKVGNGKTIVEDLKIEDMWSNVNLSLFMMSYANALSFQDFISKVCLDGNIEPSILDFETISYFAPELKGNRLKAVVSGSMSGPIDDFIFSDIKINSLSGGFTGTANGRITGLPDIARTRIDADLDDFVLTSDGLGNFISEWMMGKGKLDLGKFAKGMTFSLNVKGTGLLNDMGIAAEIGSLDGNVNAEINLKDIAGAKKPIGISGRIKTHDIDLGKIIGTEMLGPLTMNTSLAALLGSDGKKPSVRIDTLFIERLNANSYDYSNIAAVGNLTNESFDGKIICHDPNLNFMLQGTFALSSKTQNARYKFYANIGHADLYALNIDRRGLSKVNFRASADFTKSGSGNLRGKVDIGDLLFENRMGKEDIGDISLNSYSTDNTYVIRMDSDFANGKYIGSAPITTFISDLKYITLKQELPAMFADSTYTWNSNSYELSFRCSNSMDLLSFVMPGLYVDEGTALNMTLDKDGRLVAALSSNRLAFGKNYLKGITASVGNKSDILSGTVDCKEIRFASRSISDNNLDFQADDNHIGLRFSYDNHSDLENKGELIIRSDLYREDDIIGMDVNILPSAIHLNSKKWNLHQSQIRLKDKDMAVDSLRITSGDEQVLLHGRMSNVHTDTLSLNLDRFDISLINSLFDSKLGIKGAASGCIQLTSPLDDKGILADLICDSTYIADTPLGVMSIGSIWNEDENNFGIYVSNELEGKRNIRLNGSYTPTGNFLNITANLDQLKVDYVQPFITDVFSEMKGNISGQVKLDGPISDINIKSRNTVLENAMLRIDYTDVPYYASGSFHLDNSGVYFDDIDIKDRYTGTGKVNGSINWNHFRDMSFNTEIKVSEIEGIALEEGEGEGFYGNIFGTGNISITGPMNSIMLNVDAVTAKSGELHIPLSGAATAGKVTNLLRFKEKKSNERIDPYEQLMIRLEKKENKNNDFAVRLRVNANPEVNVFVEIDKASGNVLSGHGNGLIDLEASVDKFNINGDYTLTGGNYKFVAMGLVSRDFQIQNGSSIRFNGDIMQSKLDINAIYRTKASLSTLIADMNSVSNKRTVDCGISITDQLMNPRLGFSIDIPDLNPMIKSRVESALSTEDKIQKQFLSLIVSNNFLPDEQSGIVNNSSVLYSNVTEMFANQLSNILHKLDIPLDLGLNYQPNEQGNDMFDVAVSTQLFNNRVVVNGNIGNRQYSTGNSQNDVVGDLDIEIKLDRSGSFRLNIFSHSADQFSNYLDNSQRNGVGLMYQTEFNHFNRFIRSIFISRKKREEFKLKEEQALLEGGKIELKIESPKKTESNDRKER